MVDFYEYLTVVERIPRLYYDSHYISPQSKEEIARRYHSYDVTKWKEDKEKYRKLIRDTDW